MSASGHTSTIQKQVEPVTLNPLKDSTDPTIQSLSKGEIPKTEDIKATLDGVKEGLQQNQSKLDGRGKLLADDATELIDSAQRLIADKNKDGKLQDFVQHSREAARDVSNEAAKAGVVRQKIGGFTLPSFLSSGEKRNMNKDAREAFGLSKDLAFYLFRSGEMKTLLIDVIAFLQNVLNEGTDKLNRIGDTMKEDIVKEDLNMQSTQQQAKQVGQESADAARSKASEWSPERRREVYEKFRSLIERASKQPEGQKLLRLFWKWFDHLKIRASMATDNLQTQADHLKSKAESAADTLSYQSSFDRMFDDFRYIVDSFAGEGAFDNWYTHSWKLYRELVNDPEANKYFGDLKRFLQDAFDRPESLASDSKTNEGQQLVERGQALLQSEKYRSSFRTLFRDTADLLERVKNDEDLVDINDKLKRFGEHFALDEQGRPDLYVIQDSLVQLKNLVYPLMKEKLGAIKINKICGSTDKLDYEVEDLVVSISDILPRSFELKTKSDLKVDLENNKADQGHLKISLDLAKLKPHFENIKFWYKRKSFPKIEDRGHLDVDLSAGEGTRILIQWKISNAVGKPAAFSLVNVKCTVDKMDITVKDAKHEHIDKMAIPMFIGKIKQSVAQGIVDGVVGALQPLNDAMNKWFTTHPMNTLTDRANEQFHHAFDKTNQFIKDKPLDRAAENIKTNANVAKEAVKNKTENLRERAKDGVEQVKEKVQEGVEQVKEKVEEGKETLRESSKTTETSQSDDVDRTLNSSFGAGGAAKESYAWDSKWKFDWYQRPAESSVTSSDKSEESKPADYQVKVDPSELDAANYTDLQNRNAV
eukprot:TRINITY_DN5309_c0_g1_i3.p1 TRINITY_DN5309_c0_g1~~TRINITY_DN5309_c0_g1_i3.p1  ORF type:complete len:818 (+),score=309.46 TRINITY_DN5309_c0_g1_i3:123-2576(+)